MTLREIHEKYQQWTLLKHRETEEWRIGNDSSVKELSRKATRLQGEIVDAGWPDPRHVLQNSE